MRRPVIQLSAIGIVVAVMAFPSPALSQEIHLDNVAGFSGTADFTDFVVSGEPTITCGDSGIVSGAVYTGGTTGIISIDYSECHTSVFGFTANCRTSGSELGTITTGGEFHLITLATAVPGMLLTLTPTTVSCAGISSITFQGSVLGTVLTPACGFSNSELTVNLTSTGATQNHLSYTGTKYDLTAKTGGGELRTAAWESVFGGHFSSGRLTCT
jgi:hypothetical protein